LPDGYLRQSETWRLLQALHHENLPNELDIPLQGLTLSVTDSTKIAFFLVISFPACSIN
jgi:hypothetical protein